MKRDFQKALAWLADDARQRTGVRALQIAIGLMLWFRIATEWRYASYFFGPHGVGYGTVVPHLGAWLGSSLDRIFQNEIATHAVLVVELAGALGLLFGKWTRISTGLALAGALLLEWRLPELCDGGDNVTRIVLIYMLLLLPAGAKAKAKSVAVWLHNVGVIAIAAQLLVVYMTAGLMKANGAKWINGTAMYVVSQIDWFSLPAMRGMFKNPWIVTISTYATIFFQVWFPFAVFSRVKLLWLGVGFFLHLNIAFFMGLIPFSLVMCGLELFLVTDEEYAKLGAFLRRGASAVSARLPKLSLAARRV
jgi:hypothetical protein